MESRGIMNVEDNMKLRYVLALFVRTMEWQQLTVRSPGLKKRSHTTTLGLSEFLSDNDGLPNPGLQFWTIQGR